MSEPTAAPAQPQEGEPNEPEPFDAERAQAKIKKANNEAANLRARLKELEPLAARAKEIEAASQSETERAVSKARQEADQVARSEERGKWAQRLAAAQFVALAARRNSEFDAQAVLDDLNLARYVGDDGEPDEKALSGVVERLVPGAAPNPRPTGNADLGPRTNPAPTDPRQRALAQIEADLAASRRK